MARHESVTWRFLHVITTKMPHISEDKCGAPNSSTGISTVCIMTCMCTVAASDNGQLHIFFADNRLFVTIQPMKDAHIIMP